MRSENPLARSPGCTFFLIKVYLFKLSHSKHRPPTPVTYGNIFIFCSHCYRSKATGRARQGGSQGGGSWRALVYNAATASIDDTPRYQHSSVKKLFLTLTLTIAVTVIHCEDGFDTPRRYCKLQISVQHISTL